MVGPIALPSVNGARGEALSEYRGVQAKAIREVAQGVLPRTVAKEAWP